MANSWQQPVTEGTYNQELVAGYFHFHLELVVNNGDPANTDDNTVTCTGIPAGSKGVLLHAHHTGNATNYISIKDMGGTEWWHTDAMAATGNQIHANNAVPVTSKQFKYAASSANVSGVYIYVIGYYL
jgi:hypothetical protein